MPDCRGALLVAPGSTYRIVVQPSGRGRRVEWMGCRGAAPGCSRHRLDFTRPWHAGSPVFTGVAYGGISQIGPIGPEPSSLVDPAQGEGLQIVDRPESNEPAVGKHHDRKQAGGPFPFVQQLEPKLLVTEEHDEVQIGRWSQTGAVDGTRFGCEDETDAVRPCLRHRSDPHTGLVGQGTEIRTDADPPSRDDAVTAAAQEGADVPGQEEHQKDDCDVCHDASIAPRRVVATTAAPGRCSGLSAPAPLAAPRTVGGPWPRPY